MVSASKLLKGNGKENPVYTLESDDLTPLLRERNNLLDEMSGGSARI
jgi:hypothetical protein